MTLIPGQKVICFPDGKGGYLVHPLEEVAVGDMVLAVRMQDGSTVAVKLNPPSTTLNVLAIPDQNGDYIVLTEGGGRQLEHITRNISGGFDIEIIEKPTTAEVCKIRVDSDDSVHVVTADDINGSGIDSIYYRKKTGSTWSKELIGNPGNHYAFFDLVLDADDSPHIFWFDCDGAVLEDTTTFWLKHSYIDTGAWVTEEVIETLLIAFFGSPSVVIDAGGYFHIAAPTVRAFYSGIWHTAVQYYIENIGGWSVPEITNYYPATQRMTMRLDPFDNPMIQSIIYNYDPYHSSRTWNKIRMDNPPWADAEDTGTQRISGVPSADYVMELDAGALAYPRIAMQISYYGAFGGSDAAMAWRRQDTGQWIYSYIRDGDTSNPETPGKYIANCSFYQAHASDLDFNVLLCLNDEWTDLTVCPQMLIFYEGTQPNKNTGMTFTKTVIHSDRSISGYMVRDSLYSPHIVDIFTA